MNNGDEKMFQNETISFETLKFKWQKLKTWDLIWNVV